ncbi:MAG: thrombospondin type 3 repeat-containing protein, partial [Nitrososphaera sp.]
TSKERGTLYNGSVVYVQGCCLTNNSMGESIHLFASLPASYGISILTSCSTSSTNHVELYNGANYIGAFQGAVECSPQGGNTTTTTTTTQQQSSMTGSSQDRNRDGDRDGIPDANDNCPNLPNARCYKEGDTALVVHNRNR